LILAREILKYKKELSYILCSCHGGHFERRYQTKAEKIADLESYLMDLKLEVQAVEEHLADLKK
jgi:predicted RNase H-like nuclease (RuvC/YqgF family)